jgi:hypothetical protein
MSDLFNIPFFDIQGHKISRFEASLHEFVKADEYIDTHKLEAILGIFLLILAISSNYLPEVLGCRIQRLLTHNMYFKNLMIMLIIYYSLGLAGSNKESPYARMFLTIKIYIAFVLFNRMGPGFTMFVFILLFIILVMKNWIDYYKTTQPKRQKEAIHILEARAGFIMQSMKYIILVGFLVYLSKQYLQHGKNFSFLKFMLQVRKCPGV